MTPHDDYFHYLLTRSTLGLVYRRYLLYPRLCRNLSGRVLDVGCGIGDMLSYRPDTVGVDVNPLTVEYCRKRGLDARLMQSNQLPFDTASFDGAICDNVLEHLEHPQPLLAEVHRVLKASGHFVVGVPGRRGFESDADHKQFYDEAGLVSTLEAARFARRRVFCMPARSTWADRHLPQYCVYGVFAKI